MPPELLLDELEELDELDELEDDEAPPLEELEDELELELEEPFWRNPGSESAAFFPVRQLA